MMQNASLRVSEFEAEKRSI